MKAIRSIIPQITHSSWWLGILCVAIIVATSQQLANLVFFQSLGFSVLTLAIIIGMLLGNSVFPFFAQYTATGVDYAKNILLRAGIILYGFRITFQQIMDVGWNGVIIDILMVSFTFLLAIQMGHRFLKLDKQTAILIGAGSSICGAAAVLATEPVIRAQAHKVTIAVATVVVFGTISMFLYPLLSHYSGLSEYSFGIYIGSTVHEVAQVVVAGKNISDLTVESAVIVKMIRVMLLVPFLILLSISLAKEHHTSSQGYSITLPWFAIFFIGASIINSLHIIPQNMLRVLNEISTLFLATAMAALGLRTHVSTIKQAGVKPLILAAILFLFLVIGGYSINLFVDTVFANQR